MRRLRTVAEQANSEGEIGKGDGGRRAGEGHGALAGAGLLAGACHTLGWNCGGRAAVAWPPSPSRSGHLIFCSAKHQLSSLDGEPPGPCTRGSTGRRGLPRPNGAQTSATNRAPRTEQREGAAAVAPGNGARPGRRRDRQRTPARCAEPHDSTVRADRRPPGGGHAERGRRPMDRPSRPPARRGAATRRRRAPHGASPHGQHDLAPLRPRAHPPTPEPPLSPTAAPIPIISFHLTLSLRQRNAMQW